MGIRLQLVALECLLLCLLAGSFLSGSPRLHGVSPRRRTCSSALEPTDTTSTTTTTVTSTALADGELEGMATRANCQRVEGKIPNLLGSKALGVDWGTRRIGLGVTAGFSQSPLTVIPNPAGGSRNVTHHIPVLDEILRLAKIQGVARIVVGMPYYRNGTMSPQGEASLQYARWLADRAVQLGMRPPASSSVPPFLYMWDERLTSQTAMAYIMTGDMAYTTKTMDAEAACLILRDFYQQGGEGSHGVYPDPDITPLSQQAADSQALDENDDDDGDSGDGQEEVAMRPEDVLQQVSELHNSSEVPGYFVTHVSLPFLTVMVMVDGVEQAQLRLQQQILRQRQKAASSPPLSSRQQEGTEPGSSTKKKSKKKKKR